MIDNQEKWNRIYRRGERFGVPEIVVALAEYLDRDSRVLDYGCGNGQNSIFLAQKGLYVIGFDISDEAVRNAEGEARRSGVVDRTRFFVSDALDPELDSEELFDGVVCTYVLDHLAPGLPNPIDPEKFELGLNHVKKFVKPGGLVAVSYSPKNIWPKAGEQEAKEIDRKYPAERFRIAFSGWEELFWDVRQRGKTQTGWGIKNNLDAQILARKPLS